MKKEIITGLTITWTSRHV